MEIEGASEQERERGEERTKGRKGEGFAVQLRLVQCVRILRRSRTLLSRSRSWGRPRSISYYVAEVAPVRSPSGYFAGLVRRRRLAPVDSRIDAQTFAHLQGDTRGESRAIPSESLDVPSQGNGFSRLSRSNVENRPYIFLSLFSSFCALAESARERAGSSG